MHSNFYFILDDCTNELIGVRLQKVNEDTLFNALNIKQNSAYFSELQQTKYTTKQNYMKDELLDYVILYSITKSN